MLQDLKNYVPPKPPMEQQQQWPTMVLEPMFWLLYAVQSMIAMGECCTGSFVLKCLPAGPCSWAGGMSLLK